MTADRLESRMKPAIKAAINVFQAYGIEIEYVIVDAESLDVRPFAARLLRAAAGKDAADVPRGDMGWSNELTLHQIEIKNLAPTPRLDELALAFQREVSAIDARLEAFNAQLMPGGMHPWMDPGLETRLWDGENAGIYAAYDRLFDCRRHGWANLQSVHINLPFGDDQEFAQLHAAVRLVLPILPALAASSPYAGARATGYADYRMAAYRDHQARLPATMGKLIPETSASPADYRRKVLAPMYRQLATRDETGELRALLRHEWLNARAAIPRFDRQAIEIRVVDVQECPQADLAIAAAAVALIRRLYESGPARLATQGAIATDTLARILAACIRDAERAQIDDLPYLSMLGCATHPCSARELWGRLLDALTTDGLLGPQWAPPLQLIIDHGPLARRLLDTLGPEPSRESLHQTYREICLCLKEGRMFRSS
jgi:glutamate---cysteine ligase / carboxylate-amine ligase